VSASAVALAVEALLFSPYGSASNIDVAQVVLGRAGLVRGIGEMLLLLVSVSSPCLHATPAAAAAFMCASRIMHDAGAFATDFS
jgi:hypothetical protein